MTVLLITETSFNSLNHTSLEECTKALEMLQCISKRQLTHEQCQEIHSYIERLNARIAILQEKPVLVSAQASYSEKPGNEMDL